MASGLYLGTRQFANIYLGSHSIEEVYLGTNLLWTRTTVLPIGSDTMFLGGVASTIDLPTLQSSLVDDTITFYRELAGNVYASSSTDYGISAAAFGSNTNITSYIDGGRCKAVSASAFQNATNLATASFTSASFIGTFAFAACSNLRSASFPEVVTINNYAFQNTKITNATFPKATSIAADTFSNNSLLVSASFPLATTTGQAMFFNCPLLATASLPLLTGVSNLMFAYCTSLVTASFPNATTIGNRAFEGCASLKLIPTESVTLIGTQSFQDCTSLTRAVFPLVTGVGNDAFNSDTALITASFPLVTSIGANAFRSCTNLATASFPNATSIGQAAFQSTGLVTASFPKAVSVGLSAFYQCPNLVSASFPSASSVSGSAFLYSSKLANVYLPALSGPNALGQNRYLGNVFYGTTATGSITLPAYYLTNNEGAPDGDLLYLHGLLYNSQYNEPTAYYPYWNITYLTGSSIFIANTSLTQGQLESKLLGETITYYDLTGTTLYASSSTNYHISESSFVGLPITAYIDDGKCTAISGGAFISCTQLRTASFAGVTEIVGENSNFYGCSALQNANFPRLQTMTYGPFINCTSLQYIDLPEVQNISIAAFLGCSSLINIAAPKATAISASAFSSCTNLGFNGVAVNFPKVETIGSNAFSNCSNLQNLYFPALSGNGAIGGSSGNNNVFLNVAPSGYITVPSFYQTNNAGNPDGDLFYLQDVKGWTINYI